MDIDSSEANGSWFAAQVWVGREHLCVRHLLERGYQVFLPTYREHRRWSDRVKVRNSPLFAGYVFCRSSSEVNAKLITTPGVIRLVGDGRRPLPVAAHEIEALQRVVEAGLQAEPWSYLKAGQRVWIEAGPLRGTEGVVINVNQRHRLVVSVTLLQRSVAVEIDPEYVRVPLAVLLNQFPSDGVDQVTPVAQTRTVNGVSLNRC